jgi:hypothetical protein
MLMPPTWFVLEELGACGSVAGALRSRRSIRPITPRFRVDGDEIQVELS